MQWWKIIRRLRKGLKGRELSAQVPAHTEAQAISAANRMWLDNGEQLSRYRPAVARPLTDEEMEQDGHKAKAAA